MAGRARYRDQVEEDDREVIDARAPLAKNDMLAGRNSQGLTDPLVWSNQFRRNDSQLTALPARPVAAAQPAGGITQTVLDAILPHVAPNPFGTAPLQFSLNGAQPKPATPPLSVLASGGQNHQQMWEQAAAEGRKRVMPFVDRTQPIRTTFAKPKMFELPTEDLSGRRSPFSWGSAFR